MVAVKRFRERPVLNERRMVDAAIRIADEEGLGQLNARRLAKELGVVASALYRHVPSMDALHQLMLAAVFDEVELPESRGRSPQEQIVTALLAMRQVLSRHPGVHPLFASNALLTPNALHVIDDVLANLLAAGMSPAEAMSALRTLVAYLLGDVLFDRARSETLATTTLAKSRAWFRRLRPDEFPAVAACADQFVDVHGEKTFESAVRGILAAMIGPRKSNSSRRR